MDDLVTKFRAAYDTLLDDLPDPPPFDSLADSVATITRESRPSVWWRGVVAATLTLAVFGFGTFFLTESGPFASPPIVEHLVIEYSRSVNLKCAGMEIADDAGPDEMAIDLWVDYEGQDARLRVVGSDGSTYEVVTEDGLAFPTMTWASGRPVGRQASCYTSTTDGTSHLNAIGPVFDLGHVSQFFDPAAAAFDALRGETTVRGWQGQGQPVETPTTDSRGRPVTWYIESTEIEDIPAQSYRTEWAIDDTGRLTEYIRFEEAEGLFAVTHTMTLLAQVTGPAEPGLFSTAQLELRQDVGDAVISEVGSTTTSIVPLSEPLMEDAQEVDPDDIPDLLIGLAAPSDGDRFYRIETGTGPVFVRLRPLEQAFLFGPCQAIALIEIPNGWQSDCVE